MFFRSKLAGCWCHSRDCHVVCWTVGQVNGHTQTFIPEASYFNCYSNIVLDKAPYINISITSPFLALYQTPTFVQAQSGEVDQNNG